MGEIDRIEARLNDIHDELEASKATKVPTPSSATLAPIGEDLPTNDAGRSPYQMAASQKNQVPLSAWVDRNRSDPAIKVWTFCFPSIFKN